MRDSFDLNDDSGGNSGGRARARTDCGGLKQRMVRKEADIRDAHENECSERAQTKNWSCHLHERYGAACRVKGRAPMSSKRNFCVATECQ